MTEPVRRAKKVNIGKRLVGDGEPTFIVAEIGSNHDGSLNQAKKLIQAAKEAGADAVKFQSFSAEKLLNQKRLEGKTWIDDPSYAVIKRLELPIEWHLILKNYCEEIGLIFLCTPFDLERAELLNSMSIAAFKIASGDLTYVQLIKCVAGFKRPVILSTGASFLKEVEDAVHIIKSEGNEDIILLHCISEYPPRPGEANLAAIATMRETFRLPVGFSDHSQKDVISLGAISLGACVVEKHITFDRSLRGPDHRFALTVDEFAELVKDVRDLEEAFGSGIKEPARSEFSARKWGRRGIYAEDNIPRGTRIAKNKVKIVRPCLDIEPKDIEEIVGRIAKVDIYKNEAIAWDKLQ